MMRKIEIPAVIVGLLLIMVIVFAVQGWRAASEAHARLLPRRAATIALPQLSPLVLEPTDGRGFVFVDFGPTPPARLGLYQVFPERSLVRWIEDPDAAGAALVVPLAGLPPGRYAICAVDPDATAGPREMDLPFQELDVRARFELQ